MSHTTVFVHTPNLSVFTFPSIAQQGEINRWLYMPFVKGQKLFFVILFGLLRFCVLMILIPFLALVV